MLSLRLALRQIRYERLRSVLLILALVVPICFCSYWFTLRATSNISAERQTIWTFGTAAAIVKKPVSDASELTQSGRSEVQSGLESILGAGASLSEEVSGTIVLENGNASLGTVAYGLESAEVSADRFVPIEGQWPAAEGEVVLSTSVASALGLDVGDTLTSGDVELRVVGLMRKASTLDSRFAVMTPDSAAMLVLPADEVSATDSPPYLAWSLHQGPDQETVERLESSGWGVLLREAQKRVLQAQLNVGDITNVWLAGVAVLAFAELTLIISGVYSILYASKLRESGLLAVVGAPLKIRQRIARWDGTVLALTASVVGVVLGVTGGRIAAPILAARENQVWEDFHIPWPWLALLVSVAVIAGATAASLAARGSKFDVVAALAGVENYEPATTRRAIGKATVVFAVTGIVASIVGAVLKMPVLVLAAMVVLVVAAARLIRYLYSNLQHRDLPFNVEFRLAAKASTRYPGRSTAFSLVILTLVLLTSVVAAMLGGSAKQAEQDYVPGSPDGSATVYATKPLSSSTVQGLAAIFETVTAASFTVVAPPEPPPIDGERFTYWGEYRLQDANTDNLDAQQPSLYCGTQTDVETVLGRPLTAPEASAFNSGEALVTVPITDNAITVEAPEPTGDGGAPIEQRLPAIAVDSSIRYTISPLVMISPSGVTQLGGVRQPNVSLTYIPPGPRSESVDQLEAKAQGLLSADVGRQFVAVEIEDGSQVVDWLRTLVMVTLALMLLASTAVAMLLDSCRHADCRTCGQRTPPDTESPRRLRSEPPITESLLQPASNIRRGTRCSRSTRDICTHHRPVTPLREPSILHLVHTRNRIGGRPRPNRRPFYRRSRRTTANTQPNRTPRKTLTTLPKIQVNFGSV